MSEHQIEPLRSEVRGGDLVHQARGGSNEDGRALKRQRDHLRPRSAAAFAFIRGVVEREGRMPTAREIANHMGWKNANSGRDVLIRLAAAGWLEMETRDYIAANGGRDGWRYTYKLADGV